MRSILLSLFLAIYCSSALGFQIDPSLKFSEMVDKLPVAVHFENLTVHHPFWEAIGRETLAVDLFIGMTQQDQLYVENLFNSFRILAQREMDPVKKAYLESIGNDNWDAYFGAFYEKFNSSRGTQMVSQVLEYAAFELTSSRRDEIGVALASFYPCYTVWAKMGTLLNEIADLPNNPDHIYKEFIEANSGGMDSPLTQEFIAFVDSYYEATNTTQAKQKMLDAYSKSVEFEWKFAQVISDLGSESIPPPKFTDLADSVVPSFQDDVIHHPLYEEIALATLPLESYAVLMQQDHIYMRDFYKAFSLMERKEEDPELKALLTKNGSNTYAWFETQYAFYGFGPAYTAQFFAKEYMDHITETAECKTVGEGLAGIYPCYVLWVRMGEYINELANLSANPDHPYKDFVMNNDPEGSTSLTRIQSLINGYFERLGDDWETKSKMFSTLQQSIMFELTFANGVYKMGLKEIY